MLHDLQVHDPVLCDERTCQWMTRPPLDSWYLAGAFEEQGSRKRGRRGE